MLVEGIRTEILQFAALMEHVLQENEYKNGWEQCSTEFLYDKAYSKLVDLENAAYDDMSRVPRLAAAVANYVMMINYNNTIKARNTAQLD